MMQNVKKRLFSGLTILMLLVCMCYVPVAASEESITATAQKGVARVVVQTGDGEYDLAFGSAFGIGTTGKDTDTFVTNRHVVTSEGASGLFSPVEHVWIIPDGYSFTVSLLDYYDSSTGSYLTSIIEDTDLDTDKLIECEVLHYSSENDFAVIKASESVNRTALRLASSAHDAKEGDDVITLGFPSLSDISTSTGEFAGYNDEVEAYRERTTYYGSIDKMTTHKGTISMFTPLASENNTNAIQYDAAISGGNSGGPLVDASTGNVLGINTWSSNYTETMNYAVDIDYVIEYLDQAGIPYDKAGGSSIPWIPIIVVVAVIVVAVVVIFVLRSRRPAGATNNAQGSRPVQTNPGNQADRQSGGASGKNGSVPRFCPHCGAPLNDDAKFCGNCGKPVS